MARKISDIMSKSLQTIDKDKNLGDAARQMKEKSIRHLLVVERASGVLLGMITDRDLKKLVSPFIGSAHATPQDNATVMVEVGRVMIPRDKIVAAKVDDEVKATVEKMLMKKYGAIPVVDAQGRAVGIVTRGDMLKLLVSLL